MRRMVFPMALVLILSVNAMADIPPTNPKSSATSEIRQESNWGPRWLWIAGGGAVGAALAAAGIVAARWKRK